MTESLKRRASRMKWFHALDLGDFQTSGRFPPGTPQNRTLFPVIDLLQHVDLRGLDCLDVGTAHGLAAFGMAHRGAASVTATDVMEEMSPPWELAREALGLDVEYCTSITFNNILDVLGDRRFDVIVCAGVIYHMLSPFDAIVKARRLLRPNGLLVLETACRLDERRPVMDLNSESGAYKEIYTYWIPSRTAATGMLRLAGLDPLAERSIKRPDRLAIIAKNVPWAEVRERTELCRRMHEMGLWATDAIERPEGESSNATYAGPEDATRIEWESYKPDWHPHPTVMTEVVGKTTWLAPNRNF